MKDNACVLDNKIAVQRPSQEQWSKIGRNSCHSKRSQQLS